MFIVNLTIPVQGHYIPGYCISIILDPWNDIIDYGPLECSPVRHSHVLIRETVQGRDERVFQEAQTCLLYLIWLATTCLPSTPTEPEPCNVEQTVPSTWDHLDVLGDDIGDKISVANPVISSNGKPCPDCLGAYDPDTGDIQINPSLHETRYPNSVRTRTGMLIDTIVHERLHRKFRFEIQHGVVYDLTSLIMNELFGGVYKAGILCPIDWNRQTRKVVLIG